LRHTKWLNLRQLPGQCSAFADQGLSGSWSG
jgi:hypothetical protein